MNMGSRGFTLIEMLIVLLVVLLIVSFLPFLLDIRWLHDKPLNRFNHLEWQVFLQQLKSEIRESKQLESDQAVMYAYKPTGEKVSFEKYGSLIRRRVNDQGNEVVLQSVSDVRYELAQNGVRIIVVTTEGKRYEAFVSTFFPIKVKQP
ncbi:competence protein ComGF [Anoxybacillus tepidamans]|uniref:Competence protein ComGF n=1 Tax=Anoxybacteroides tepidamans TaxID=265948 RepID=A0A7W8IR75_9BACL|nr:competence type IV pilus minor pilin ComGF [Anoxybacillus tepidamans]MBB5325225.1 competence protein ComGF [Anoxybacillus tepidamans]